MEKKGLQHEIGKKHPFESLEQEAFLNLVRTYSHLTTDFARLFRPYGLSEATYNTLRILRGAGPEGRTCGEIGAMLISRVPDVTRLVDRLVESGLVARLRGMEDRRVVKVMITARGLALLAALDEPLIELHRKQLRHMSEDKLRQLSALLEEARNGPCRASADAADGECGGEVPPDDAASCDGAEVPRQ